jgi:hypothetical protein
MEHGPAAALHGYQIDASARTDLRDLRYQWFDHVFKEGALPSPLKDTVNYEVMGANTWRHAPSLEGMADRSLKFYMEAEGPGNKNRLTQHRKTNTAFVSQVVSLADRSDADWTPPVDLVSKDVASRHGAVFVSDPLPRPMELDGLFSGLLDFTVNKMDMDLDMVLYERLAHGEYVRLYGPSFSFRASYARDRSHRHLLKSGERQELSFKSERITARRLEAGSRLVMVLGIVKRPDREINYGTGNDVSAETIADGRTAVKIRWYGGSYIEIPVHR